MDQASLNVLLLTEGTNPSFQLQRYLEQRGCRCWLAGRESESLALLNRQPFAMILSTHRLQDTRLLVRRAEKSYCHLFFRLLVEDGSWWVPVVCHGRKCLGNPALRPAEFLSAVDEIIRQTGADNEASKPKLPSVVVGGENICLPR